MLESIVSPEAPRPVGPYSQAIRAGGFLFVSGQIPIDAGSGNLVGNDIGGQTRQVMMNLRAVLRAGGSDLDRIVKTSVFLVRLDDFAEMNAVYAEFLGDAKPARATVQVAGLPRGALIEIEAVALA